MKKLLSLLLAVVLSLTALACGTTPEGPNDPNNPSGPTEQKTVATLVDNGKSAYSIIIPADSDECHRHAADELKKYIEQSSGARLPILTDDSLTDSSTTNKYISLGNTTVLEASGITFDYKTLNGDGFFIKTHGSSLLVNGYRNSGVLYGAYEILESTFGVRFLTDDYVYVPKTTTVELKETDVVEVPAFESRDYYAYPAMNDFEYTSHMRFGTKYRKTPLKYGDVGANAWFAGSGHNLLAEADALVPYSTYGAAHPDWYYNEGQELRYTSGITEDDKFDSTDTDSLAYNLVEICKQKILANPTARYFMLGQPDNNVWDDSPEAKASKLRNGTNSGTLMVFVNAVAGEIEKWLEEEGIDRDVLFVTFAYWKTIDAPVKLNESGEYVAYNENVVPRDNVAVMIAHMTCSYHSLDDKTCSSNITAAAHFEQWGAIAKNLFVWDYNTNFDNHFFWYPNFNSLVKNIRYYVDKGVVEVMTQGAPHVGNYYQCKLEGYLFSKLLWNPDLDVNDLIAEFNALYYGDSAGAVDEFVELMRAHYASIDDENHYFHNELYSKSDFKEAKWYPIDFLERAISLLEDEIARVEESALGESEKIERVDRLYQVWLHPAFMKLTNYDSYYTSGKRDYAVSVFDVVDRLGVKYYGEGASIGDLKTQYGVA